jgi:hypothetical protein
MRETVKVEACVEVDQDLSNAFNPECNCNFCVESKPTNPECNCNFCVKETA